METASDCFTTPVTGEELGATTCFFAAAAGFSVAGFIVVGVPVALFFGAAAFPPEVSTVVPFWETSSAEVDGILGIATDALGEAAFFSPAPFFVAMLDLFFPALDFFEDPDFLDVFLEPLFF